MINVDCVTDIEREIANCIKTEQEVDDDITDIKSEPSILDGEKRLKSVHKGIQHICESVSYTHLTLPTKRIV